MNALISFVSWLKRFPLALFLALTIVLSWLPQLFDGGRMELLGGWL